MRILVAVWLWLHRLHVDEHSHFIQRINESTAEVIPSSVVATVWLLEMMVILVGVISLLVLLI